MARSQKLSKNVSRFSRSLVATAFLTTGMFQLVAPALADGAAPGTKIKNTATATYQDPNNLDETLNATSNTVEITIAEVAGVTVTANGTTFRTDTNGNGGNATTADGKINNGDVIYYNYTVKNVGNDPTKIRIPNQPPIQGNAVLEAVPDSASVNAAVQISDDGGVTWKAVNTGTFTTDSMVPGESVLVRVAVKVTGATSGNKISLQLGNTKSKNAQNIPLDDTPHDVYTVDNPDGATGETNGTPINGTREASATYEVTVDSTLKNYALATVLKTRTAHTRLNDPSDAANDGKPIHDTIDYELKLRVENDDPTGNNLNASALEGTTIQVDAETPAKKYILVSDAIPTGTELAAIPSNLPTDWEAVYTEDDVTGASAKKADKATWKRFSANPSVDLANVKRVGFIKTGIVNTGETVSGLKIQLKVTSTGNTVDVANIAQLFGASGSNPVYDESGDQTPSNYDSTNTKFPGTDSDADGLPDTLADGDVDDGHIDNPTTPTEGTDSGNNNQGTGDGGEANVISIGPAAAKAVLNGPEDLPAAASNGDNNKDFTNRSALTLFCHFRERIYDG